MKRQFLFLILLLFTLKAVAADDRKQEVDSLLVTAKEYQRSAKMLPQLESAMKALDMAIDCQYDKGKTWAHFWIADALINIGLIKEGFQHLEDIENTNYYKQEVFIQSETHRVKGRGHLRLQLFQQAIREFQLQLAYTKALEGEIQQKSYLHAYGNIATAYDRLGQLDSVQKYCELQLQGLKGFDEKKHVLIYLGVFDALGQLYTKKDDFSKAHQYFEKSLALVKEYNVPIYFNTYTYLANLEEKKENRKQALEYYHKGLANMKEVGDWNSTRRRYKFLANYYRLYKLGNDKAEKYELAYALLNDSLEKENAQVMDVVLNQVLKSKDQESASKVSKSLTISIIALLLLLVAITFFVWRSRHNRKVLGQREDALQETETINRELTEQIGENKFNNLIELAKSNNPEFLTLFTELYPQFIEALKSRDSNLRSTELEFCAMAFLNFSTKNIAEYTFVTIRAVQVRKNRLRKKFDIPSDADFNNWMRNQISPYQLAEGDDKLGHDDIEIIKS